MLCPEYEGGVNLNDSQDEDSHNLNAAAFETS